MTLELALDRADNVPRFQNPRCRVHVVERIEFSWSMANEQLLKIECFAEIVTHRMKSRFLVVVDSQGCHHWGV